MRSRSNFRRRRNSNRLRGWDYTSPGAYFVTICTHHRELLFDEQQFHLIANNAWQAIPQHDHAQHVRLDESVVMPDHLHGILILTSRPQQRKSKKRNKSSLQPGSVGAIVGNFKSSVTKQINSWRGTPGSKVWLRGYHDRIIRDEKELNAIRQYIRNNPIRWAEKRDNLDVLLAKMRWVR